MTTNESGRPDKIHRVVVDLHPVQQEVFEKAKDKFRDAHDVTARDADICRNAIARFCEKQGETFPTKPPRSLREREVSRYAAILKQHHAEHPDWGPAALARGAGCSLSTVRRLLPDLPALAPKSVQLNLLSGTLAEGSPST